jgi:hypothetical protein
MHFDKPRLFSGDGQSSRSGSDRTIGFDAHRDLASPDSSLGERATDEELGLSAELQILAAHLRGEADSLANRYAPASCPTSPPIGERRFARPFVRGWIWQSMAVAVAGLVLLAWQIDRWQESPPAAAADAVVQTAIPGVAVATHQQIVQSAPSALVSAVPPSPAAVSPSHTAASPAAIRHTQGIAEVGIDGPAVERHPPADQVEMLRIQALGFEKVIRKLQAELVARDAAQIESQRQIQSLQEEVLELHKQLDDRRR